MTRLERQPAAVVREQFEAVNRGDFARAMDLYAEDVELVAPASTGLNAGVHKGKEAVGEFFGDWMRTFSARHFELLEIHESGDKVALGAHHTATGRESGVEVESDLFYSYEVRDGKVARVEFHERMSDAMRAIGL